MEDAYIAILDLGNTDTAIFGVFDGHGGRYIKRSTGTST